MIRIIDLPRFVLNSLSRFPRNLPHKMMLALSLLATAAVQAATAIGTETPPLKVEWVKEFKPSGLKEVRARAGTTLGLLPAATAAKDGVAVAVGVTGMFDKLFQSHFLKIGPDGAIEWQHELGDVGWVTGVVATPNGYVVSQEPCFNGCNEGLRLLQFSRDGKLIQDLRSTLDAGYRLMRVVGNRIELVRSTCDQSACWIREAAFRYSPKLELIEKELLVARIALPVPSEDGRKANVTVANVYLMAQERLVDMQISYPAEKRVPAHYIGRLYAIDDQKTTKWSVIYADSTDSAYLTDVLPVPNGYILSGLIVRGAWAQQERERIPATDRALRNYLSKTASLKPGYEPLAMAVDRSGRVARIDPVPEVMRRIAPDCSIGIANDSLIAINDRGKVLWSINLPLPVDPRSAGSGLFLDGNIMWLVGRKERGYIKVSKIELGGCR
jgi:hypothetical protein